MQGEWNLTEQVSWVVSLSSVKSWLGHQLLWLRFIIVCSALPHTQ